MRKSLLLLSFLCFSYLSFSQNDSISVQDTNQYRFVKTDGGEIFGKILSQDAREILVLKTIEKFIFHNIRSKKLY